MADIAIFRINYKSDFILTLQSDAGWLTPFCIKFWTGAPSQAYYAYYDGMSYTHCAPVDGEPTKLLVQFDDHHLPIGDLKFQIGYHFTVADFSTSVEDEVINQASVIIEVDDAPAQVMLDFNGETAPEIQFALPAYANEAQRIANEQARIAAEEQRISNEEARIAAEQERQQNEQQRISREQQRIEQEQQRVNAEVERVNEFAALKTKSEASTDAANGAATLANEKAQLADDKAALAQAAATLANEKAQLAEDKANLAQQKADYAQTQGNYAKAQGDAAKTEAEAAHSLNEEVSHDEATRQQQEAARQQAEAQRVIDFNAQMQQQQTAYTNAEAARDTAFDEAETERDAKVDAKVADITNLQAQIGYFVCDTNADTAAKTIVATGYALTKGGNIRIKMTNANTVNNATLNINSTGAKPLFYEGVRASSTNSWAAGDVLEIYYDGTNYRANNVSPAFKTGEKVNSVGVDNEPTAGSNNILESGTVADLMNFNSETLSVSEINPGWVSNGKIISGGESTVFRYEKYNITKRGIVAGNATTENSIIYSAAIYRDGIQIALSTLTTASKHFIFEVEKGDILYVSIHKNSPSTVKLYSTDFAYSRQIQKIEINPAADSIKYGWVSDGHITYSGDSFKVYKYDLTGFIGTVKGKATVENNTIYSAALYLNNNQEELGDLTTESKDFEFSLDGGNNVLYVSANSSSVPQVILTFDSIESLIRWYRLLQDKVGNNESSISAIESEIEDILELLSNKYFFTFDVNDGYYYVTNGEKEPTKKLSISNVAHTIIDVYKGDSITLYGTGLNAARLYALFDENGNAVNDYVASANQQVSKDSPLTLTMPCSGHFYVQSLSKVQFAAYINFDNKTVNERIIMLDNILRGKINEQQEQIKDIDSIVEEGVEYEQEFVVGQGFYHTDGTTEPSSIDTSNNSIAYSIINIVEGDKVILYGSGLNQARLYALFDVNGFAVEGYVASANQKVTKNSPLTLTMPQAGNLYVQSHKNADFGAKVIKKSLQEQIDNIQKEEFKDKSEIKLLNSWKDKKVLWFGTSIPAGGGATETTDGAAEASANGYPGRIAKELGFLCYNEAVGSSQMAKVNSWNGGRIALCMTIAEKLAIFENVYIIDDSNQTYTFNSNNNYGVTSDAAGSYENAVAMRKLWMSMSYEVKLISRYLDETGDYLRTVLGNRYNDLYDSSFAFRAHPDLICLDHSHNNPITTVNEELGTIQNAYIAEEGVINTDRTTWVGAMNTMILTIIKYLPHTRIALIADYQNEATDWGMANNPANVYNGRKLKMRVATRMIAEYWELPWCDICLRIPSIVDKVETQGYWTNDQANGIVWHDRGFTWNENAATVAEALPANFYFNSRVVSSTIYNVDITSKQSVKDFIEPRQDTDGTWYYKYPLRYIWMQDGIHPYGNGSNNKTNSDCMNIMYAKEIVNWLRNLSPTFWDINLS